MYIFYFKTSLPTLHPVGGGGGEGLTYFGICMVFNLCSGG